MQFGWHAKRPPRGRGNGRGAIHWVVYPAEGPLNPCKSFRYQGCRGGHLQKKKRQQKWGKRTRGGCQRKGRKCNDENRLSKHSVMLDLQPVRNRGQRGKKIGQKKQRKRGHTHKPGQPQGKEVNDGGKKKHKTTEKELQKKIDGRMRKD